MTPDSNPAIRELLESRLDALHEGQERIERVTQRIESQVKETNGRVTAIELREAMAKAALQEHRRMEAVSDHRNEKWIGIFPAFIVGASSGLTVLLASLILTGQL